MSGHRITAEAEDKKLGMSIDEVGAFLQRAHRLGFAGDVRVRVTAGFSSQVKALSIEDGDRA